MNWNLKNIYETDELFYNDYKLVDSLIDEFKPLEGNLHKKECFAKYLRLEKQISILLNKVYPYAHLASDLDKRDTNLNARYQSVITLFEKYNEATSFIVPEYLKLGLDYVLDLIPEDLKEYEFMVKKCFKLQEHVLDEKIEAVIAQSQSIPEAANIYSALSISDSVDNEVLINGKMTKVTSANYPALIANESDPEVRKQIFEAVFSKYRKLKNTYAEIYLNVLKRDWAYAKIRGYKSCLEADLFHDSIDPLVYKTLIEVANETSSEVKRYLNFRKEYFKLDELHTYDRFLKMGSFNKEYTYQEALDLFFEAIKDVDPRLNENLHKALEDGYVDVYEKEGKRNGAYSSGNVGIHPFIMLNFANQLEDVFTIAHEAGHSSHTIFACDAQPIATASYTIFVAEIASTFNEHLLADYLLEKLETKEEKLSLIQKQIDNLIATFYRQTLFAEYELKAHELVEKGEPVTTDTLTNIMVDLYNNYYGIDITKEESKAYVWAYVPHMFYTPFYVYQYATCYAASLKVYENVKKDKSNYDSYIKMLQAGGSDYSLDIVKISGVDLTKKESFLAVANRLKELIDKLIKLTEE